jgi:hypothetical protein
MVIGLFQGLIPTVAFALSITSSFSASANLQAHLTSATTSSQSSSIVAESKPFDQIAQGIHDNQVKITLKKRMDHLLPVPRPVAQVKTFEPVRPIPVVTTIPVTQAASVMTTTSGPLTEEQITYLGNCEAGMNPTRNSGNGYYGAFQFSYGTWKSMNTGYERADMAPIEVQKDAVQRLVQRSSIYTQFPGCSRKMHAAGLI